ncbi:MAG: hypothetical protein Q8S17_03800 [Humidesulfovibrio sp.]|nr:hypothetical protein [Humidesulfovibrio sp.]
MRPLVVLLCAALLAPALLNPAQAERTMSKDKQAVRKDEQAVRKAEQTVRKDKQAERKDGQKTARVKKPRQKISAKALQDLLKPGLSQRELLTPYSAMSRQNVGPAPADGQGAGKAALEDSWQANATSWKVDLSLDPKRLNDPKRTDRGEPGVLGVDSPLRFRLGRETVLDPLTHKELTPRADPLKAKQSLEELNLKGALGNLGGKAEVQVDVLKF